MKLSQFKFNLPSELIALQPIQNRDEARLMVVDRKTGKIEHRVFKDLVDYTKDGDVFVINNTKVFPAKLYGEKEKTGAKIEVLLLRELDHESRLWDVLVDPARKIRIGNKLYFGEGDELVAEVIDNTTSRGRTLRFLFDGTYDEMRSRGESIRNDDFHGSEDRRNLVRREFKETFAREDGKERRPRRESNDRTRPRRDGDRPRRDGDRPHFRRDDRPRRDDGERRPPRYTPGQGPTLGEDKEVPIIHGRRKSWKRRDLPEDNNA